MPSLNIYEGSEDNKRAIQRQHSERIVPGQEPDSYSSFGISFRNMFNFGTAEGQSYDINTRAQENIDKFTGLGEQDKLSESFKYDLGHVYSFDGSTMYTGEGVLDQEKLRNVLTKYDDEIKRLQSENPNLGLLNYEQLLDNQADNYRARKLLEEKTIEENGVSGKVQQFTGGALAYLSTPLNFISTMYPAGKLVVAGKAVLTGINFGAVEAGVNALLQLKDRPGEIDIRRRSGEDLTNQDIALESFTELLATFGIATGVGMLIGRFTKGALPSGPKSPENPITAEFVNNVTDVVSQGAKNTDRVAVNTAREFSTLAETTPQGMSQAEHAVHTAEGIAQATKGEEITVGRAVDPQRQQQVEVAAIEEATQDIEQKIATLRDQSLDTDVVTILDKDGNGIEINVKQELTDSTNELDILKFVDTCSKAGG